MRRAFIGVPGGRIARRELSGALPPRHGLQPCGVWENGCLSALERASREKEVRK
jgi:hypothetical protein